MSTMMNMTESVTLTRIYPFSFPFALPFTLTFTLTFAFRSRLLTLT